MNAIFFMSANKENFTILDPRLQAVGEKQLGSMKEWFDKRLDEAYIAAEEREKEKNSKCMYNHNLYRLHIL